jgi:arylsulfatase A-like enzyme
LAARQGFAGDTDFGPDAPSARRGTIQPSEHPRGGPGSVDDTAGRAAIRWLFPKGAVVRVLYFDIDSLRADHLGCYGYPRPTSPNIDRLAREGMRFDRCYVTDSPCMPSRTSFITGRFGFHHGIVTHGERHNQPNIPQTLYGGPQADYQLLPIRLRQAGWAAHGFSTFPVRHSNAFFSLGWSGMHTPSLQTGGEKAGEVADAVIDWLERNGDNDDSFLYINFWDPHRIYKDDLKEYYDRIAEHPVPFEWPDDEAIARHARYHGPFTAGNQFPGHKSRTRLMPGGVFSREDYEHMVTGYDAMIAYADEQLGRILAVLEEQGTLDDTAVIVTADHGDAFGEHGVYSDHVCAHEPVHRVPLVVRWPGVARAGASNDHLLYHIDIPATVCDLVAGEVPTGWDGASFAPLLRGEEAPRRSHLVWGHGLYTIQRAVRTESHLLLSTDFHHRFSQFRDVELYRVAEDPWLQRDIADEDPDTVADLRERLLQWRHAQAQRERAIPDPLEAVRATRERLGLLQ